jgi:transposase-like protein
MQRFVPVEALFKGRHFNGQIIIRCVSWYTRFKWSLRDLVILRADRATPLTHSTILLWSSVIGRNWGSAVADRLVRWADPGGWTHT